MDSGGAGGGDLIAVVQTAMLGAAWSSLLFGHNFNPPDNARRVESTVLGRRSKTTRDAANAGPRIEPALGVRAETR